MTNVVIAGYKRSPFTPAKKGQMAKVRPDDIAAQVIKALVSSTGVKVDDIEDVIMGCAFPEAEQGFNVGKISSFIADLPKSTAGATVNRFCGSSMQSIHQAAGAIKMGAGEVFIAAGVESMTRVPMGGFNPAPNPELYARFPGVYISMGITAENVAKKHNISRTEQQEFAINSHEKAAAAAKAGKFGDEIVAITSKNLRVEEDGCIRAGTTQEGLNGLEPAFDKAGTVTAGTSSPLTDGASAVLVCSEDYADRNGLTKLVRIKSIAVSGCDPEFMGLGPVQSVAKVLKRAGLTLGDIDIFELNEAFAAQSLGVIKELGADLSKINLDGGAIALGHPLGASGARITGKAASVLKREGGKYAISTMCIGGGMGIATLMEAI